MDMAYFEADLRARLESAPNNDARADILREPFRQAFAALPPLADELRESDDAHSDEECLATANYWADECARRQADGPDAHPYPWYGHGEHSAAMERMPFMGALVIAHRRTGDEKYAATARDLLLDFNTRFYTTPDDVPEAGGNFLSAGIRLGAWDHMHRHGGMHTALREWHAHPLFSFEDWCTILRGITHACNALVQNLGYGTNQRIFMLQGLLTQGLSFRRILRDGEYWLQTAAASFNADFPWQFLDDGSFQEPTLGYGRGSWFNYVRLWALSKQAPELGLSFEDARFERIFEYYLSSLKPFGVSAAMGDVWTVRGPEQLRPDAPPRDSTDWKGVRGAARLMVRHLDCPAARFALGDGPPPAWTSRHNPDVGYMYLRDGWQPDSLYLNFNAGYWTNPHCHYSVLGIEVAGYGREWIVDPGNAGYNAHPKNVNMNRTRGHGTLTVDGLNQVAAGRAHLSRLHIGRQYDFAIGALSGGYVNGTALSGWEGGVWGQHFRHILFVKGSYWILFDAMQTLPGHTIETRLPLMPSKMRALPGGGWATGYTEGNLALVPLLWDGWDAGIHEGEEDPIEGWLPLNAKPEFVPAPVYKATRTATKAPADWHGTLLLPFRAADPPRVTVRRHEVGPIGFACEIETDAWRDLFFLSNSFEPRTYRLGEIETDCPLCHIRFVDGRPVSGMTCDGNFLRIGRKPVFEQGGAVLAREYDFTVDPPRITTAHPRQRHR